MKFSGTADARQYLAVHDDQHDEAKEISCHHSHCTRQQNLTIMEYILRCCLVCGVEWGVVESGVGCGGVEGVIMVAM